MASKKGSEQRCLSIFDLPSDFLNSCRLISDSTYLSLNINSISIDASNDAKEVEIEIEKEAKENEKKLIPRWSCNTCKEDFDSLLDQRSHFKSDFHRFNVKLSVSGKEIIKEVKFNAFTSELFEDYDVSSLSGSEDEVDKGSCSSKDVTGSIREGLKQKIFICLKTGGVVSVWKCILIDESDGDLFENNKSVPQEEKLIERLKCLTYEPRDKTRLRTVLLASGGHFAGCVFDGNIILAHKTFHRYVVRAKAGKKQSGKDATGKAANSAGASLRRHNELALKKEVQELLVSWKPYFDSSVCVFIYAPSSNRQLFYEGEKACFSDTNCIVSHVPFTVRRPTLNEAKRIYNLLTSMIYEIDEKGNKSSLEALVRNEIDGAYNDHKNNILLTNMLCEVDEKGNKSSAEVASVRIESNAPCNDHEVNVKLQSDSMECKDFPGVCSKSEAIGIVASINEHTALHEAARSGDAQRTLELLEQGVDPCIKDARGRTPYMLATEKEVRNTFRRFMALNLDKWDWHDANVPSLLTKEMEEAQAAKQAEKDAKRKAKSKELKKLRRAKERAKAQAASVQTSSGTTQNQGPIHASVPVVQPPSTSNVHMNEDEMRKALAAEREKRAAAAEKRIAALKGSATNPPASSNTNLDTKSGASDLKCSCCMTSLAGKVPFHRYHYKYCSTSCMHVHREMLEDG